LAYVPYAVWLEVSRFSIGLGAFAVVVAYPWRAARMDEDPRRCVFRRLFLTLMAGGALSAVLGLAQEALGNGDILWISEMRHLRQISDDRLAVHIFAQRQRNLRLRFGFFPVG